MDAEKIDWDRGVVDKEKTDKEKTNKKKETPCYFYDLEPTECPYCKADLIKRGTTLKKHQKKHKCGV
jgi:hypothetical protein